jgi:hypothetical protein
LQKNFGAGGGQARLAVPPRIWIYSDGDHPPHLTNVEATIQAICKIREGDGVVLDGESVKGTRIKAEDEYEAAMHS